MTRQRQAWPSRHWAPRERAAGGFGVADTGAWLPGLRGRAGLSSPVRPHQPVLGGLGEISLLLSQGGGGAGQLPGTLEELPGRGGVGKPGGQGRPGQGAGRGLFSRDARPCRERRGVAAASSRGEALLSFSCHPPSWSSLQGGCPALAGILLAPSPQGCQMGSGRGSQVRALAPAPSLPEGPGGARRRAWQAGRWWAGRGGCPGRWADSQDRWWAGQGSGACPICSRPLVGLCLSTWGRIGRRPRPACVLQGPFCPRALGWVFLPRAAQGSCSPLPRSRHRAGAHRAGGIPEHFPRVRGCPGRAPGTRRSPGAPGTGRRQALPCRQQSAHYRGRGVHWGGRVTPVGGQPCFAEDRVAEPMQASGWDKGRQVGRGSLGQEVGGWSAPLWGA